MKSELKLKFKFVASHSLAQYEEPHSHLWKLAVVLGGELVGDKMIDIPLARQKIQTSVDLLSGSYLNENSRLPDFAQRAPTCETLGRHFFKILEDLTREQFKPLNPSLHFVSVKITICDLDGSETGSVKLSAH